MASNYNSSEVFCYNIDGKPYIQSVEISHIGGAYWQFALKTLDDGVLRRCYFGGRGVSNEFHQSETRDRMRDLANWILSELDRTPTIEEDHR